MLKSGNLLLTNSKLLLDSIADHGLDTKDNKERTAKGELQLVFHNCLFMDVFSAIGAFVASFRYPPGQLLLSP